MSNWLWLFPITVAVIAIIDVIKFEYKQWKKRQ